jgi:hypothetical protein
VIVKIKPGTITLTSIAVMFLFVFVASFGCKKPVKKNDPCEKVTCYNNGVCDNGKCNCLYGYEDEKCETAWNYKFLGWWQLVDEKGDTFNVNIKSSHTNPAAIVFDDFWKYKVDHIVGALTNSTQFEFSINQNVNPGAPQLYFLKEGEGGIDQAGNLISGYYIITEPDGDKSFSYKMYRQGAQ